LLEKNGEESDAVEENEENSAEDIGNTEGKKSGETDDADKNEE